MNSKRKPYGITCCVLIIFLCLLLSPLSQELQSQEVSQPIQTLRMKKPEIIDPLTQEEVIDIESLDQGQGIYRKKLTAEKLLRKGEDPSKEELSEQPEFRGKAHIKKPLYKDDDKVFVTFKKGVEDKDIKKWLKDHGLKAVKNFSKVSKIMKKEFQFVEGKKGVSAPVILASLLEDPNDSILESASLNYVRQLNEVEPCEGTIPNDPYFGYQWPLCNTGEDILYNIFDTPDADIDATDAWDIETGSEEVVVAVLDTGVNYLHPDLKNIMWVNQAEASGTPGVDDDGNGYIDDIHGIDTGDDDSNPLDFMGHGTHVAGIIASEGNNALGITGVNWKTKIIAVKGFRSDGYLYLDDELEAIDYIIGLKQAGVNIVAINASYGGYGLSQSEKDFIEAAGNEGIIFVAAAGNNANDNDVRAHYPSSHNSSNIISVAATDMNDKLSTFSNYGLISVDLAAPGNMVLSTYSTYSYYPGRGGDIFFDDMESGSGNWSVEGTWAITEERSDCPGPTHVWSDSPDGNYQNNTTSDLISDPIDLSGVSGLLALGFGVYFDLEENLDWLDIYFKSPSDTWVYSGSITGSSGNYFYLYKIPISETFFWDQFQVKFTLNANESKNNDGVYLDIIGIGTPKMSHNFSFLSGTSMATPHVSGAIALIASGYPDADANTIIKRILSNVDPLTSLYGKVATGGRLNLYKCFYEVEECSMKIQLPPELQQEDAYVNIKDHGGPYHHGDTVSVPQGIDIQWSLTVNGVTGEWKTKSVDCTDLIVTGDEWCSMEILIPNDCPGNAACADPGDCAAQITVDIMNVGGPYTNGAKVLLQKGTTIQWSLTVNGLTSGLKTKPVDCTPLQVGEEDLCCMHIQLPKSLQDAGATVNIKDLGIYRHCRCICLPKGITIQWSLTLNGITGEWKIKSVDCTDLVVGSEDYKELTFKFGWTDDSIDHKTQILNSALVDNGKSVILPTGADIEFVPVVHGFNLGVWKQKTIDSSWQGLTWNLVEPTYE